MLQLEGHTDSIGTDEYNMQLSQKRAADAVRDYLVSQGVTTANVTVRIGSAQGAIRWRRTTRRRGASRIGV